MCLSQCAGATGNDFTLNEKGMCEFVRTSLLNCCSNKMNSPALPVKIKRSLFTESEVNGTTGLSESEKRSGDQCIRSGCGVKDNPLLPFKRSALRELS